MSRASRPPSRTRLLAAAGLALPMSQVGHAASYLERYGTPGLQVEREDVHAYFPQLFQSSAEVLGLLLLAVLVVLAAGRMALGRGLGLRHPPRSGLIGPLLTMAVLQFDLYVVQESVEAIAAYQPYTFALLGTILGWGLAGQLPVAFLAAGALTWLATGWEASLRGLRSVWRLAPQFPGPLPPPEAGTRPGSARCAVPLREDRDGVAKRGPPPGGISVVGPVLAPRSPLAEPAGRRRRPPGSVRTTSGTGKPGLAHA